MLLFIYALVCDDNLSEGEMKARIKAFIERETTVRAKHFQLSSSACSNNRKTYELRAWAELQDMFAWL